MARIKKCGPLEFRKGTNPTCKGKYSSTLTEPLQIQARANSYYYSLGRSFLTCLKNCKEI